MRFGFHSCYLSVAFRALDSVHCGDIMLLGVNSQEFGVGNGM